MPEVIHRQIAWTPRSILSEVVREMNLSLRQLAQDVTKNYREAYPQVDAAILANTTQTVWIPLDSYEIEAIALRTSSGTASVTPRIGGVALGVTGGTPITATTTATEYAVTTANAAAALSDVDCVVTGLAGSAWLTLALRVRRVD